MEVLIPCLTFQGKQDNEKVLKERVTSLSNKLTEVSHQVDTTKQENKLLHKVPFTRLSLKFLLNDLFLGESHKSIVILILFSVITKRGW